MLKPFLKKYGWKFFPGGFFLILCSWISTRAPIVLGEAVDLLKEATDGGVTFQMFLPKAMMILWIALGVFATRLTWRYFIIGSSRELEIWLRNSLYDHLQKLPVSFYGTHRSGDMMAYAVNDVNSVRMVMGMVLAQSLNASTSIFFSVKQMAAGINGRLTVIALAPIPLAIFLIVFIGRRVQRKFRRVQEQTCGPAAHAAVALRAAVGPVADDGTPQLRRVNSDLMHAPSLELKLHQRYAVVAPEHVPMRNGG